MTTGSLKRWSSRRGLETLTRLLHGDAAAWRGVAALQRPDWELGYIQKRLYRRGRPRRWRPTRAAIVQVAAELDLLRDANPDHLDRLEDERFRGNRDHLVRLIAFHEAAATWNNWRRRHGIVPDLRGANLADLDLRHVDLTGARLAGAELSGAAIRTGQLRRADLRGCHCRHTDFSYADLAGADLRGAVLKETLMTNVSLAGADLRRAWLIGTFLNQANLSGADLRGAIVWGVSAWDVRRNGETRQQRLLVVPGLDPIDYDERAVLRGGWGVRVDDLEVAHFISMLIENPKIGRVINAAAKRVVLLLGRFAGAEAGVLPVLRDALEQHGYVPVVFDFEEPDDRDTIETVAILAGLSSFVIANLSRPRSTPLEAHLIIPTIAVPFVPIVREGEEPFSMFTALQRKYPWVLPTVRYRDERSLLRKLRRSIIVPAERAARLARRTKHPAPPTSAPKRRAP
jgi:hypothetical protein